MVHSLCARVCGVAVVFIAASLTAWAQTDEIQVYDANIAEVGKFNLMLHNNFTPDGARNPAFPGAVISDHALVGVAEWAYGVTPWFEQGPLPSALQLLHQRAHLTYNGFKLRWLFVKPHAEEHTFFYGVNFEFSVNQNQWNPRHFSSEVRPIIGWHLHPVDIIVNPIVDTEYTGGVKSLDFAPSIRVAYILTSKWSVAAEEYADYGPSAPDLFRDATVAPDLGGLRSRREVSEHRSGHWLWPDGFFRQSNFKAHALARSQLITLGELVRAAPVR